MVKRIVLSVIGLLVGGFMALPAFANGSIDFSNPVLSPSGSDFLVRYIVSIDNSEFINTSLNPSFATLYDIPGLVPGSAAFTVNSTLSTLTAAVSVQNTGITPVTENPVDSASLPNITTTFTGTAPPVSVLGTLSFLDTFGVANTFSNFTAQATLVENDSVSSNLSSTLVPSPDPSTALLMIPGLVGIVALKLRKK